MASRPSRMKAGFLAVTSQTGTRAAQSFTGTACRSYPTGFTTLQKHVVGQGCLPTCFFTGPFATAVCWRGHALAAPRRLGWVGHSPHGESDLTE